MNRDSQLRELRSRDFEIRYFEIRYFEIRDIKASVENQTGASNLIASFNVGLGRIARSTLTGSG